MSSQPSGHGGNGHHDPHAMHLPHGSIWPFWLAVAITLLGIGLLALGSSLQLSDPEGAHVASPLSLALLGLGLAAVVAALAGWFAEDHRWWKTNTGTGLHIPKAGVLLFISSELFLFGALFSNYFTFQHLAHADGLEWPGVELPLLKTGLFSLFLFASSGTIHHAEALLKKGDHKGFVLWWWITVLLGAVFLGGQVWEYANLIEEGHTLGSSQFMTAFYILTGTHGLHVFGGLCVLGVMGIRASKGQFTAERHAGPEVAAIYWHFVDIVWVFVLTVLYILPALGYA